MNEKFEFPVVANIVDVKGLDKIVTGAASAYADVLKRQMADLAATQTKRALDLAKIQDKILYWSERKESAYSAKMLAKYRADALQAAKGIRNAERLEQKKANLLKHVTDQAAISHELSERMIALSEGGLPIEHQQAYLNAAIANRAAFRALTGRDITGMMDATGVTAVRGAGEFLNREINAVRSKYKAGPKAEDALSAWNAFISSEEFGGDLEAYLQNRDIDKSERLLAARSARSLLNKAVGAAKQADWTFSKETTEEIERAEKFLQRVDKLIRIEEGVEKSVGFMAASWKTVASWVAAGAGGIALGSQVSNTLASIYRNTKDPFTQGLHTAAAIQQGIGGSLGAIIGGGLGALLAPVTGGASMYVGAAAGGAIGAFVGGGRKRSLERAEGAQEEALQRLRYQALYGGRGNQTWARLVEQQTGGMVTAGTIEDVVSNAESFQSAMAFGKISDDQWIALANMPNLMGALMSGADEKTIFDAYRKDIRALPNGLGKMFTQMLGMGFDESTRAWAKEDTLWRGTNATRWYAEQVEKKYLRSDPGFAAEVTDKGFANMKLRELIYRDATRDPGRYKYQDRPWVKERGEWTVADMAEFIATGALPSSLSGVSELVKPAPELGGIAPLLNPAGVSAAEKAYVKSEINVVVNGEKTRIGTVLVEEEELANLQNFVVGAI